MTVCELIEKLQAEDPMAEVGWLVEFQNALDKPWSGCLELRVDDKPVAWMPQVAVPVIDLKKEPAHPVLSLQARHPNGQWLTISMTDDQELARRWVGGSERRVVDEGVRYFAPDGRGF